MNFGAGFFGWLVAVAMAVLLAGVIGATGPQSAARRPSPSPTRSGKRAPSASSRPPCCW